MPRKGKTETIMEKVEILRDLKIREPLEQQRSFLEMLVYLAAGRDMNVEDYLATLTVEEEERKKARRMPATSAFRVWKYHSHAGTPSVYALFGFKTVTVRGGYCMGTDLMKVACRAILTKGWYPPEPQEKFPLVRHVEFKPDEQDDDGLIVKAELSIITEESLHQACDFALELLIPAVQAVYDHQKIQAQLEKGK